MQLRSQRDQFRRQLRAISKTVKFSDLHSELRRLMPGLRPGTLQNWLYRDRPGIAAYELLRNTIAVKYERLSKSRKNHDHTNKRHRAPASKS